MGWQHWHEEPQASPQILSSFFYRAPSGLAWVGAILAYCCAYSRQRQAEGGCSLGHNSFQVGLRLAMISPPHCLLPSVPVPSDNRVFPGPREQWFLLSRHLPLWLLPLLCPSGWSHLIFFKFFWWPPLPFLVLYFLFPFAIFLN